jgi:FtsZ-interacting cell division protein ZipA
MSTGLIVAIVVVVLILIALAIMLPRMKRQAQVKARERELGQRRDRVATEHQQEASQREREAEAAEQKARMAQAEAERQRSEAQLHEQKADMHQRGLADDELIDDHERDHFAPALERRDEKAADERTSGGGGMFSRDRDGDGVDDSQEGSTATPREGGRAHEPAGAGPGGTQAAGQTGARSEYEQGRVDEREAEGGRFDR